jgi:hypothetical protein
MTTIAGNGQRGYTGGGGPATQATLAEPREILCGSPSQRRACGYSVSSTNGSLIRESVVRP